MSALFTLRVSVPGQCDPPGSTGERGDADVGRGGDARSRPGLEDRPGPPRWETLEFRAGNPRAEIITGRIRLYRDAIRTSDASASPSATTTSAPATSLPEGRSPMVCVLAVPIELSVADFCQFAAAIINKVTEMRIVQAAPRAIQTGASDDKAAKDREKGRAKAAEERESEPADSSSAFSAGQSSYAVILSFEDQDSADSFALNYHNRRFSCLVEGECRALFVRAIELEGKDGEPFDSNSRLQSAEQHLSELPSCPVCLDRLDQDVSGVVTTVCSHSFHAACLSGWGDSSCPVCRYTQNPEEEARCQRCGRAGDLWACLVCGAVGCGRYARGCSLDHWNESDHCYALELTTQRVWDYVRDGFVHRLIQSKTGLVELAPGGGGRGSRVGIRSGGGARGDEGSEIVASPPQHPRRRGKGDDGGGGKRESGDGDAGTGSDGGANGSRRAGDRDARVATHGWLDEGLDEYDADYPLDEGLEEALVSSKLDAIHTEYNALLTSQLDSQRRYFEGLMAANNAERDGALSAKEAAESRARVIAGAVDAARDARAKLQEAHAKIDDGLAKNAKLEEERDFFKQLNDTLLENQRQLRANLDATEAKLNEANETNDAKIRDLQEQVRDLMVFIEAQSKLAEGTDGGDSIEGGDVVGVSDGDAAPSRDAAHARLQSKLRARRKSGK